MRITPLLALLALLPATAHAETKVIVPVPMKAPVSDVKLTEDMIRIFYAQTGTATQKDFKSFLDITEKSLHPSATSTDATSITMGNLPPVVHTEQLTRAQMIDGAKQFYDALKGAKLQNNVLSIKLAVDGKAADVTDETLVSGLTMNGLSGNSHGLCRDTVVVGAAGTPQILRSNCTVEITILPLK